MRAPTRTSAMPVLAPSQVIQAGQTPPAGEMAITFPDNRCASALFGQYDQNLARIERGLGITAHALGNQVTVKGAADACERARHVLQLLYDRIKGGQLVTLGDVDGAIKEGMLQGVLFPAGAAEATVADKAPFDQIATRRRGPVRARNAAQSTYLRALKRHELVFAEGPAGTGKTWLAVGHAVSLLEQGLVERLILSRPAVEAGERLGFLPGDMRDKVDPYLRPIFDALNDFMDPRLVERGLQTGMIEVAPLAFMRGRTLTNACVLLDEAQNAASMQMKMFLTRLGENSRMIVTGDPTQVDLPHGQRSGLAEAITLLAGLEGIGHIVFKEAGPRRSRADARPMPLTIDLAIDHEAWTEAVGDLESLAERAVAAAWRAARESDGAAGAAGVPEGAELSLLLCGDDTIRIRNRQWRGKDKPTNVLSFPAPAAMRHHALGDIAVAYETCAREAAERGVPLADHLAHLIVHGMFHLLDYDHGDDAEAERMEGLEARALASLGLASPFADDPDGNLIDSQPAERPTSP